MLAGPPPAAAALPGAPPRAPTAAGGRRRPRAARRGAARQRRTASRCAPRTKRAPPGRPTRVPRAVAPLRTPARGFRRGAANSLAGCRVETAVQISMCETAPPPAGVSRHRQLARERRRGEASRGARERPSVLQGGAADVSAGGRARGRARRPPRGAAACGVPLRPPPPSPPPPTDTLDGQVRAAIQGLLGERCCVRAWAAAALVVVVVPDAGVRAG